MSAYHSGTFGQGVQCKPAGTIELMVGDVICYVEGPAGRWYVAHVKGEPRPRLIHSTRLMIKEPGATRWRWAPGAGGA